MMLVTTAYKMSVSQLPSSRQLTPLAYSLPASAKIDEANSDPRMLSHL